MRVRSEAIFREVSTYDATRPLNVYRQASLDVIFGQLWSRPGLSRRQRRWVSLAVVGLKGVRVASAAQVYSGLNSGDITLEELGEFLLQLACYSGFPMVSDMDAAIEESLRRIASERGEPMSERVFAELRPEPLEELIDGACRTRAAVHAGTASPIGEGSPAADLFATAFVYGQVWSRPQLPIADRRLIALTCLAIQGDDDLVRTHVATALESGDLDATALRELALHVSFYAGGTAGRRIDAATACAPEHTPPVPTTII
jgi:4-carboxymuconolactone decarboxylase